jgi:hypothetical protein
MAYQSVVAKKNRTQTRGSAGECGQVARPGLEPDHVKADSISSLCESAGEGGAKSGALPPCSPEIDRDLALIIQNWESLPMAIQKGMAAMARASIENT